MPGADPRPDTEQAGIDRKPVTRWLAGHVGGLVPPDASVTGAEFYVMGYVDGQVLADRDAGLALAPEARATAGEQMVDVLVALHALDPAEAGLGDLVRRTCYVERQLRRRHAQVHASETAEHTSPQSLALLDEVHSLLARRVPAQGNGVVHGDFRPGNMAFGPDVLDDRAGCRGRPHAARDPRGPRRRPLRDQRAQVVHLERLRRGLPHRHGGD